MESTHLDHPLMLKQRYVAVAVKHLKIETDAGRGSRQAEQSSRRIDNLDRACTGLLDAPTRRHQAGEE